MSLTGNIQALILEAKRTYSTLGTPSVPVASAHDITGLMQSTQRGHRPLPVGQRGGLQGTNLVSVDRETGTTVIGTRKVAPSEAAFLQGATAPAWAVADAAGQIAGKAKAEAKRIPIKDPAKMSPSELAAHEVEVRNSPTKRSVATDVHGVSTEVKKFAHVDEPTITPPIEGNLSAFLGADKKATIGVRDVKAPIVTDTVTKARSDVQAALTPGKEAGGLTGSALSKLNLLRDLRDKKVAASKVVQADSTLSTVPINKEPSAPSHIAWKAKSAEHDAKVAAMTPEERETEEDRVYKRLQAINKHESIDQMLIDYLAEQARTQHVASDEGHIAGGAPGNRHFFSPVPGGRGVELTNPKITVGSVAQKAKPEPVAKTEPVSVTGTPLTADDMKRGRAEGLAQAKAWADQNPVGSIAAKAVTPGSKSHRLKTDLTHLAHKLGLPPGVRIPQSDAEAHDRVLDQSKEGPEGEREFILPASPTADRKSRLPSDMQATLGMQVSLDPSRGQRDEYVKVQAAEGNARKGRKAGIPDDDPSGVTTSKFGGRKTTVAKAPEEVVTGRTTASVIKPKFSDEESEATDFVTRISKLDPEFANTFMVHKKK